MLPSGTRREFLDTTSRLVTAATAAGFTQSLAAGRAHAAGSDEIQLALIGCGEIGRAHV